MTITMIMKMGADPIAKAAHHDNVHSKRERRER